MRNGTVYTETVVWSPPVEYVNDAPYQLAIVEQAESGRLTVRILGDRVQVGDAVEFVEDRNGVPYFRKAGS
jgi:uncharacterized OB-fold protein